MRRRIAALAFSLALLPTVAGAQVATPPATEPPPLLSAPQAAEKPFDYYPIVIGLGAVAGVVAFNALAIGIEALPGGMAAGAGAALVPAEASVAISRVYAVTSAVTGALIAYYLATP